VRVLGVPVLSPKAAVERVASDLDATTRLIRGAPAQLDRLLELGEEIVALGARVVDLVERLDRRAEAISALGERCWSWARRSTSWAGRSIAAGRRSSIVPPAWSPPASA
jgi:hypothetical protein